MFFINYEIIEKKEKIMTLREKIKKQIESVQDSNQTTINICKLLYYELDLSGNGWFDNDEVMQEELYK